MLFPRKMLTIEANCDLVSCKHIILCLVKGCIKTGDTLAQKFTTLVCLSLEIKIGKSSKKHFVARFYKSSFKPGKRFVHAPGTAGSQGGEGTLICFPRTILPTLQSSLASPPHSQYPKQQQAPVSLCPLPAPHNNACMKAWRWFAPHHGATPAQTNYGSQQRQKNEGVLQV